jgi:glutamate synthase (ferredoxin)
MTGGKVVVIGKTGRNFAAGMSGGTAYVYDPDNSFRNWRCNLEMVELETMSEEEASEIFGLIKDHYHLTDSAKAISILEDWDQERKSFVKVMPTEYKRALARLAEEQNVKQTV